jgi:hypothetical protein
MQLAGSVKRSPSETALAAEVPEFGKTGKGTSYTRADS